MVFVLMFNVVPDRLPPAVHSDRVGTISLAPPPGRGEIRGGALRRNAQVTGWQNIPGLYPGSPPTNLYRCNAPAGRGATGLPAFSSRPVRARIREE